MQRNNNHIIVIGIVVMLLILTYNMALVSEVSGANDTGKTIVPWIQAMIAILALFFSVYNMYQQEKATQRQINLSLFEKRYKIYKKCIKSLDYFIDLDLSSASICEELKKQEDKYKTSKHNAFEKRKNEFLVDEKIIKQFNKANKIIKFIFKNKETCNDDKKILEDKIRKLKDIKEKLRRDFKEYLDFTKI